MKHETSAPGSSAPLQGRRPLHSDILLKDQALVKSKPNCQPGMNLKKENTEKKYCLQVTKKKEKESFVGDESSKRAERALEGEQSTEGELSSPAVPTAHRGSPGWVLCRLLHTGASRTVGYVHQQPRSPPGALI